ncbi:hypothetical protein Gogos_012933 [Gossypium gossypioides]|uniref:3-hydroxyacyl-CoA dehydrogenase C-terminal domain-containing protein n=1 Tax=Gossypium gossypioides TaxID=34282 RepID=A0A7J9BU49_GOSGO|nr:hypothetical protein [Gossypium gossypioides]
MQFVKLSEKDIVEMIFFPVVNEACRVFAEGIAVKASDIDIAAVMGMGFPPYRGGLMFWADSLGSKYIYLRLEEWSNLYGGFFKPCAFLAERAAKGAPLVSKLQTVHIFDRLLHEFIASIRSIVGIHCVSQSYEGILFSSYLKNSYGLSRDGKNPRICSVSYPPRFHRVSFFPPNLDSQTRWFRVHHWRWENQDYKTALIAVLGDGH